MEAGLVNKQPMACRNVIVPSLVYFTCETPSKNRDMCVSTERGKGWAVHEMIRGHHSLIVHTGTGTGGGQVLQCMIGCSAIRLQTGMAVRSSR